MNIWKIAQLDEPPSPTENKRDYILYLAINKLRAGESIPINMNTMPIVEGWEHPEYDGVLLTPDIFYPKGHTDYASHNKKLVTHKGTILAQDAYTYHDRTSPHGHSAKSMTNTYNVMDDLIDARLIAEQI